MSGIDLELQEHLKKHNDSLLLFGFVVGATNTGKISIPTAIRQYKSRFNVLKNAKTLERRYYYIASLYLSNPEG